MIQNITLYSAQITPLMSIVTVHRINVQYIYYTYNSTFNNTQSCDEQWRSGKR